jgi:hypothetical protein
MIARHVARELSAKHPGLGPEEIAAKMRADLARNPTEDEIRLIDAVIARLPEPTAGPTVAEKPALSAWVLIAANLLPLYGVLFWNWEVFPLLVLFWLENVVIGALNALKMLCADPADAALWAGKLFMVPFFCFHYGMFTAVHGVFVFSLFGGKAYDTHGLWVFGSVGRVANEFHLWLPIAALVASHLFSFFWNTLFRGEFRRSSLGALMARPYARVVILHLTILAGGFAAMALGSPLWALLLLLGIKTAIDLLTHLKEHRS